MAPAKLKIEVQQNKDAATEEEDEGSAKRNQKVEDSKVGKNPFLPESFFVSRKRKLAYDTTAEDGDILSDADKQAGKKTQMRASIKKVEATQSEKSNFLGKIGVLNSQVTVLKGKASTAEYELNTIKKKTASAARLEKKLEGLEEGKKLYDEIAGDVMNHSNAAQKVLEAREKYINEELSDHGEMILDYDSDYCYDNDATCGMHLPARDVGRETSNDRKGLVKVMLPRMDVTEEPRKNFVRRKPPKVLFVA
ncbi:hypothetical protein OEA41_007383 [Lepraria neglecta]|uniref:Uncharacterized protein n=1 Tax=Lepraria neglecta TaxID=209136 RepID=A0AAD9ZCZ5_9LECA|nr:hypothetical protein OEA41_007383 [Lepraria neglecta]